MEIQLVHVLGHICLANWQQIPGQVGILQRVFCCGLQGVEVSPCFTVISMRNGFYLWRSSRVVDAAASFFNLWATSAGLGTSENVFFFVWSIDDQALAYMSWHKSRVLHNGSHEYSSSTVSNRLRERERGSHRATSQSDFLPVSLHN